MKMMIPTTSLLVTGLSTTVPTEPSSKVQSTGSVREMATGVTQNQSAKVRYVINELFTFFVHLQ